MISEVKNIDCIEYMRQFPDKHFELAIVDPPYGILSKAGDRLDKYGKNHKEWDSAIPDNSYFDELMRVSKNQIIWGGNYFPILWEKGCKGFIFWHKHQPVKNWAAGELAWTSFNRPATCFDFMFYGNINAEPFRFHPTQKPVKLYRWLLQNYAKPGDKILDTHLGSGSSRIAADIESFDFYACELDPDYFAASCKRFNDHKAQIKLF